MGIRMAVVVTLTLIVVVVPRPQARQGTSPLPPVMNAPSVAGMMVALTWTPNTAGPPATAYQIHAGSAPGLSDLALVAVSATPTGFAASAPPGTYYVRVVAVNGSGLSAPSNEVVVVIGSGGCQAPGAPSGLTATAASGIATLRWMPPSTGGIPTGYALLVGTASGLINVGTIPVGLATTLASPAPPGTYFVRVVATNTCGASAPSPEVSLVMSTAAVAVPAGFYSGSVANFSRTGVRTLTSFTLQLNQPVPTGSTVQTLSGRWTDNRGCTKSTGIVGFTTSTGVFIGLEAFTCNDGDFGLVVTSVDGRLYSGRCSLGGPNCTFQMTRQ